MHRYTDTNTHKAQMKIYRRRKHRYRNTPKKYRYTERKHRYGEKYVHMVTEIQLQILK